MGRSYENRGLALFCEATCLSQIPMRFTVPADHPCLPGHFPGRALVPGVVLLERVLEAIEVQHPALGALRLPQVKFLHPLLPGEEARVELESTAMPGAAARWRFRVLRADTLLASGEVIATAGVGAESIGTGVVGGESIGTDGVGAADSDADVVTGRVA